VEPQIFDIQAGRVKFQLKLHAKQAWLGYPACLYRQLKILAGLYDGWPKQANAIFQGDFYRKG
jgi:hypothetical protein